MNSENSNDIIEDKPQENLIENKKTDKTLLVLFVFLLLVITIPVLFDLFEDYNYYEKIDSQDILKYDFKNKSTFSKFDLKTSKYKHYFKFKCHYAYKDGEWYIYENDKVKCTKTEAISNINHFINSFKEKDEKKKNIIDSWNK